jgi:7-keto-8-aminopelargonate synthetase-like enzyme
VVPIAYPMVPRGRARIRVMISAAHTTDDLLFAAQAFAAAVSATESPARDADYRSAAR